MPRKFILIAGPSGVGKGTLINMLMNEFPGKFAFCVSHTTRDPRPGENHGEHYHFVSVDAFKELKAQQGFVESAEVHGNMYGTSKMAIEDVQSRGMSCILDVDVQGAQQVHAANMGFYMVFIKPPSMELLRERLVGRGTETPEKVEKRMNTAMRELAFADSAEGQIFDAFLVNEDLEKAYKEFKVLLQVEEPEAPATTEDVVLESKTEAAAPQPPAAEAKAAAEPTENQSWCTIL